MKTYSWEDLKKTIPAYRLRNNERRLKAWKVWRFLYKVFPWMNWPIFGYIYSFWYAIVDEGIYATLKPRWGAVTFGWLNDGIKPTLWHTWHQLTHNHANDPYTGIYTCGAPKSLKQAHDWEKYWETKRAIEKETAVYPQTWNSEDEEVERLEPDTWYEVWDTTNNIKVDDFNTLEVAQSFVNHSFNKNLEIIKCVGSEVEKL